MKLNLLISDKYKIPKVTIETPIITDKVKTLIQCIEDLDQVNQLKGYQDDTISLVPVKQIISIKTENKRVIAVTADGQYVIKSRLYTLESVLPSHFIRISKSEMINVKRLKKLAIEPNGLIKMYLHADYTTYSSRRYLKMIKERLAL